MDDCLLPCGEFLHVLVYDRRLFMPDYIDVDLYLSRKSCLAI
jgi:hypothetical protein